MINLLDSTLLQWDGEGADELREKELLANSKLTYKSWIGGRANPVRVFKVVF